MRVYTKLIINIETDTVLASESFDYDGPVALCEPISGSLAAIGSAISAAAPYVAAATAAVGLVSSLASNRQQQAALADQSAAVQQEADINTKAANAEADRQIEAADREIAEAKEKANRRRAETESAASRQIARLGTSGVELLGSPLDVVLNDYSKGQLAARDIEYEGQVAGYNRQSAAASKRYEGELYQFQARQARKNIATRGKNLSIETGLTVAGQVVNTVGEFSKATKKKTVLGG